MISTGDPEDFLRPKLRLFLSADIVGSTAFKQRTPTKSSVKTALPSPTSDKGWLKVMAEFYATFESSFAEAWPKLAQTAQKRTGEKTPAPQSPSFWKSLGDEIIYQGEIQHHSHACAAVIAWMQAARSTGLLLQERSQKLNVKCTAWLAGFPLVNSEIPVGSVDQRNLGENPHLRDQFTRLREVYRTGHPDKSLDFIGPSIDIGFRLSRFASVRKFVLSAELAVMILHAQKNCKIDPLTKEEIQLFFTHKEPLKGVLSGEPYPVVWINTAPESDFYMLEDTLLGRVANPPNLSKYLHSFLDENSPNTFRPFLDGEVDADFDEKPDWYEVAYQEFVDEVEQLVEVDDAVEILSNEVSDSEDRTPSPDRQASVLRKL